MDGYGAFWAWRYQGALDDQPAVDIAVYRIIQHRLNELESQKRRNEAPNVKGAHG